MQTIGERLEEARKKRGISIREAAEATKIRGDYLQQFESNHFDIGLTEIYTRGFLRTYANFLKVPADRLLNDYSALGRGEAKPRSPNREVYGRMDITVATAGESSDRAAPPSAEAGAAEAPRPQPRYPRGGSSLPSGPDPALIFKYAKWAGGALVLFLLILLVKSFFSSGKAERETQQNASRPPALQPAEERSITLIAVDTVQVKVLRRNPDDTEGEELFNGTLSRGQTRVVPWPGPIYIRASAGENVQVEYKGKRYPTGFTGNNRAKM